MNNWTFIYFVCVCVLASANGLGYHYDVEDVRPDFYTQYDFHPYEIHRQKRDATDVPRPTIATSIPTVYAPTLSNTSIKTTDKPAIVLTSTQPTPPTTLDTSTVKYVNVNNKPLLGENGTGIRKDIMPNQPRVSDPIQPDDNDFNMTTFFKDDNETLKGDYNVTSVKYDNHTFYNSSFVDDADYFKQYWANITKAKVDVHSLLSNSHRRAITLRLKFDFPFYGHLLRNITIATGGFIYTGNHVHSWLAATQYIAPLMANFDTRVSIDSNVKIYDDGNKFTVIWENVTLQDTPSKTFTFAVTLASNGDIVFVYKDIPIPIKEINDKEHPVKVGVSDAYLTDKILFFVRRKTIYEYHRVSFVNYEIRSGTILKLTALPTCLQFDTCESCTEQKTAFNCSWCEQLAKCSSGMDRYKQDWMTRHCDTSAITNTSQCQAKPRNKAPINETTAYITDTKTNPLHDTVVKTEEPPKVAVVSTTTPTTIAPEKVIKTKISSAEAKVHAESANSPVAGVVGAFIAVVVISSVAAWILYAFKNPHTRSGQILIKYRPSQWSWKRGEARYTAATIHM